MSTLRSLRKNVRVVVLDMRAVPIMDATGLVNLKSAIRRLQEAGILVILGGIRRQPREVFERAGWEESAARLAIRDSYEEAIALARAHHGHRGDACAAARDLIARGPRFCYFSFSTITRPEAFR